MNKYQIWLLTVLIFNSLLSCSDDDDDLVGNWIRRSDFGGVARGDASCLVINRTAYVFGGFDGKKRLNDLWEYDFDRGYWTQKAELEGAARNSAFAFSTSDKGYIGTGYDGDKYLNDFWEYDPSTNQWTQKADFMGSARYGATAFYINGSAYVGSGFDGNYLMDFYKYNPSQDRWESAPSISGSKRAFASNFTIDGKVYVIGGMNNASNVTDFWMFDPSDESWNERNYIVDKTDESFDDDYTTIARFNTVAFVLDGLAYISTGETASGSQNSYTWEYHPTTDRWYEKTSFEGSGRAAAVGFVIDNRAFLLTGRSSSYQYDDMWEFKPFDEYNEYD